MSILLNQIIIWNFNTLSFFQPSHFYRIQNAIQPPAREDLFPLLSIADHLRVSGDKHLYATVLRTTFACGIGCHGIVLPHPDCLQTRCCDALRFEIAHHTLGSFLGKILVELLAAGVVGISYYGDIGVGELLQIICDSVEIGGGKGTWIGALVGGALGAGTGALVGNHMDKQKKALEEQLSQMQDQENRNSQDIQDIKVQMVPTYS